MIIKTYLFKDSTSNKLVDLDTDHKDFKYKLCKLAKECRNWENNSAVVYYNDKFIFVNSHAEYCKSIYNIDYKMEEILQNKHTRRMSFIEMDLKNKQIFFSCASPKSKTISNLELIAIHLEFELYRIKYRSAVDSVILSDPCIPGVGSSELIYKPYNENPSNSPTC